MKKTFSILVVLIIGFLAFCVVHKVSAQPNTNLKPALIPLPQELQWGREMFNMSDYKLIVINRDGIMPEALLLKKELKAIGLNVSIKNKVRVKALRYIELKLSENETINISPDAYLLNISENKISIVAKHSNGIFYGLQTLKQLINQDYMVSACKIKDWPAFSWRGYMVDVGRNYLPMHLLKQQIDIMAAYKLNVFHFHFTEDIAWRLESKLYPQLTAAENMTRNKGEFYSQKDLQELIRYCKDRRITLLPEIDMPGHSAAFKRAMKMDMQSDSGLVIVKNIIKEFCSTYDVPYLHIGADEVKIVNKNFLPEVISLINKLGKKVVGWEPGGNFTEDVIRQLWIEDATKVSVNPNIKYIDSRHLYLNHMDPLESVVTIFNRKIANLNQGSKTALGGTICLWPDRRVERPEDVLIQNPVYPAMLAFAERSWQGGGITGWSATICNPDAVQALAFKAFEDRLLFHKQKFFSDMPFPYVRQSSLMWSFYGPYNNRGVLDSKFDIESKGFDVEQLKPNLIAIGGTLVLRHWWGPSIKGVISEPKENTTWYASTKIWSDRDTIQDFWIGFNNLSRSYASNSPDVGTWDNRKSEVWVNEVLIPPPVWKQAGAVGNMEVPLLDEGYEYRDPAKIILKKGWNKIIVKMPIGSFKGVDWKNPEKWMFTVVPLLN